MLELAQVASTSRRTVLLGIAATIALESLPQHGGAQQVPSASPLASWNEGPAKQAVLNFVRTTVSLAPPEDRIATFDQDGTLWVEHPVYTQAMFAFERLHALAPQHPEWRNREPFKAILANDQAAIGKFSERDWAEIVFATHAGMSQASFPKIVKAVAGNSEASALQTAVHRACLSADARGDGPPARQWVQDLYRDRRRTGLRARLCSSGLWHSA